MYERSVYHLRSRAHDQILIVQVAIPPEDTTKISYGVYSCAVNTYSSMSISSEDTISPAETHIHRSGPRGQRLPAWLTRLHATWPYSLKGTYSLKGKLVARTEMA